VRSERGLGATVAADPFYFRADGARLFLSRYVVVAPEGLGLAVDPHGVGSVATTREGGREVLRVEARDVPAHVREPGQPPIGEFLPHVQVGLGGDLAEVQADLADVFASATRSTEELRALARDIRREAGPGASQAALARAAWTRVAREILGGEESGQASEALSRGRGSRLLVLQAVLGELGIRARIAVARPYGADATPRRFATYGAWSHALLRIEAGGETIWHDPTWRVAPLGTLPSNVLGVEALVLAAPGEPLEVVRTPERPIEEDRREVTVSIALRPDGSATAFGEERYTGASAAAAKAAIERLDRSDRRQVIEGMLARTFRGIALSQAEILGEDDPSAPVTLRWRGEVSALARVADGSASPSTRRSCPRGSRRASRSSPPAPPRSSSRRPISPSSAWRSRSPRASRRRRVRPPTSRPPGATSCAPSAWRGAPSCARSASSCGGEGFPRTVIRSLPPSRQRWTRCSSALRRSSAPRRAVAWPRYPRVLRYLRLPSRDPK
jgi:hypothetical protein